MSLSPRLLLVVVALGAGSLACGTNQGTGVTTGSGGATGTGGATGGGGATGSAGSGMGGAGTGGSAGTSAGANGGSGAGGSGGSGGAVAGASGAGTGGAAGAPASANPCATIDSTLPAEPTIPVACTTLVASFAIVAGTPPSESSLDTSRIQPALSGCASGQSVRLTTSGSQSGFITGPLNLPTGVSLWIDDGVTLFGTRDPKVYGQAAALITV